MTAPKVRRRANYFSDEVGEEDYQRSFTKLLAQVQELIVGKYLNPEKTHRFKHGGDWAHPAAPEAVVGGMREHSSEAVVPFDKIVGHDLTVIDRIIAKMAEDMERQFAQMMYATVSAAAAEAGNTVDGKSVGSPREAWLQALEKVWFASDKFGNVTPPEVHMSPEDGAKLRQSLAEAPPEFKQRFEQLDAQKRAEAIEREFQRKARFVRYGDAE